MMAALIRNMTVVCSVVGLCMALMGCSSSDSLTEVQLAERLAQQVEQIRLDNQRLAGLEDGLAHSLQPSVYAGSTEDTLANLLPSGETVFSALSAATHLDALGADRGAAHPALGAAYVRSVASDGEGGFRVTYVIDGRESLVHFEADQYHEQHRQFRGESEDRLAPYWLWSWTDSFQPDPDDPSATDRTDGSSTYDYFDLNGWAVGAGYTIFRGYSAYGVRTLPENLSGTVTYEGRLQAEWQDADDPNASGRTWLRGILNLEANLDDGEIAGRIDKLLVRPPAVRQYQPMADGNVINIANTSIDEARFTADWIGEDPNTEASLTETIRGFSGTVLGEFYGPTAEEVGGVLSGRRGATDTTPEQVLTGGFHGSQPEPGP